MWRAFRLSRRRRVASSILISLLLGVASAAVAQPTVPSPAVEPVDPADDPWLTEQTSVVAEPVEVEEERVAAAWRQAAETDHARAVALRRVRLEAGLGDLPSAATVVASHASDEEPALHTELALELAPDRPATPIQHAIALQQSGDLGGASLVFLRSFFELATNLPAQLWLAESLSHVAVLVLLAASFAFFVLAALRVAGNAAHDLGDLLSSRMPLSARYAGLAALVLLPFVLGEGLLGLALSLFMLGFWYGGHRQRNALAIAGILFVIGLHPAAHLSKLTRDLVDGDPVVASVFRVLADHDTVADRERLESAAAEEDRAAAHALAYRDRRHGLIESSRERLLGILAQHPSDFVALANLGSIEKRRGNDLEAIDYYERAAALEDDATLLFNLSQAYASVFRMEEYEATIVRAQRVDDRAVADLSSFGEADLVADVGFPMGLLRDRFLGRALASQAESEWSARIAPGRLSGPWWVTASAFALVVLLGLLFADRWDHASLCGRCGHRICTRCEDTVWSQEICEDCHRLLHNPETADPSLRMARLQELSERDVLFDRIWLGLSIFVPGMAGFGAKRPDMSIFALLLFGWATACFVWPLGPFADPMLMGGMAFLVFAIPGVLAALAYVAIVLISLIVRKNA